MKHVHLFESNEMTHNFVFLNTTKYDVIMVKVAVGFIKLMKKTAKDFSSHDEKHTRTEEKHRVK